VNIGGDSCGWFIGRKDGKKCQIRTFFVRKGKGGGEAHAGEKRGGKKKKRSGGPKLGLLGGASGTEQPEFLLGKGDPNAKGEA